MNSYENCACFSGPHCRCEEVGDLIYANTKLRNHNEELQRNLITQLNLLTEKVNELNEAKGKLGTAETKLEKTKEDLKCCSHYLQEERVRTDSMERKISDLRRNLYNAQKEKAADVVDLVNSEHKVPVDSMAGKTAEWSSSSYAKSRVSDKCGVSTSQPEDESSLPFKKGKDDQKEDDQDDDTVEYLASSSTIVAETNDPRNDPRRRNAVKKSIYASSDTSESEVNDEETEYDMKGKDDQEEDDQDDDTVEYLASSSTLVAEKNHPSIRDMVKKSIYASSDTSESEVNDEEIEYVMKGKDEVTKPEEYYQPPSSGTRVTNRGYNFKGMDHQKDDDQDDDTIAGLARIADESSPSPSRPEDESSSTLDNGKGGLKRAKPFRYPPSYGSRGRNGGKNAKRRRDTADNESECSASTSTRVAGKSGLNPSQLSDDDDGFNVKRQNRELANQRAIKSIRNDVEYILRTSECCTIYLHGKEKVPEKSCIS